MRRSHLQALAAALAFSPILSLPAVAANNVVANPSTSPQCMANTANFNPTLPPSIVLPPGFTASVFAQGLNQPTGIAFLGNSSSFQVFVLESGHGLPSVCNDETLWPGGVFDINNPFTPDILVFNQNGKLIRGPLGKPTSTGDGFQPSGPAIDIAFVNGTSGGPLFTTDSNQSTHTHNGNNNSSRISTVNPMTGQFTPFITNLPTGDHPTEQLAFKDGWIYWSQGSTTNSGVVGLDNGGGANQSDIPCQDITLSQNVFISSLSPFVATSGYSPFGKQQPGATIPAFFNSFTGQVRQGVCDGAILRAQLSNSSNIQAFSWGYRNPYAIRFPPADHPLAGGLLVGVDGEDERGARPTNGVPDRLELARQNPDGSPDYHGWPDRFAFLPSSQAVFNPVGGPADDLCQSPPNSPFPACIPDVLANDVPVADVLAFPPQQITAPLAIEGADSSFTGIDFVPDAFVTDPVRPGAVLYTLEGDFGFSAPNATPPAPEIGHEVKLVNFNQVSGSPLALRIQNFARNPPGMEQAFIVPNLNGFNRPLNVRFGPDGCAYVVDYGAVRDLGADSHFVGPPANGPLVQIPGTGVIWKICPM
jgi:glucose/arabinose dehydrogenase